jgi:hypothetical protein
VATARRELSRAAGGAAKLRAATAVASMISDLGVGVRRDCSLSSSRCAELQRSACSHDAFFLHSVV